VLAGWGNVLQALTSDFEEFTSFWSVQTVMFAVKNEVSANLLESLWRISSVATILKSVVFMELGHLKGSGILSLSIPGLSIYLILVYLHLVAMQK
jgi:hypothetical protein